MAIKKSSILQCFLKFLCKLNTNSFLAKDLQVPPHDVLYINHTHLPRALSCNPRVGRKGRMCPVICGGSMSPTQGSSDLCTERRHCHGPAHFMFPQCRIHTALRPFQPVHTPFPPSFYCPTRANGCLMRSVRLAAGASRRSSV